MTFEIQAGDSAEQKAAELVMLDLLGQQLGIKFRKDRFYFARPAWTEVDGYSVDPPALVEAWAHQGPPKSAQKHKGHGRRRQDGLARGHPGGGRPEDPLAVRPGRGGPLPRCVLDGRRPHPLRRRDLRRRAAANPP